MGRARRGMEVSHGCHPHTTNLHFGGFKNGISGKVESFAALPNPAMERATKWDSKCPNYSDEVYRFFGHLRSLEDHKVSTVAVVDTLRAELDQARARISHLDAERHSLRKKLDHFLRKLAEEKAAWKSREHEKIRAVIDGMKGDLNNERRNRRRMEAVNSKLVHELSEAKLSAKRMMQDYEKERKARELMEEVCEELAKEVGEDKSEVEALKMESMKVREEVEEERKMLQMAEVWREERVQMKLIDAKVALEEKYTQLMKLQTELDSFLRARSGSDLEVKEAVQLREAVESVKSEEIKEFSYQPPSATEDIFSVFEELQPREETTEREIGRCYGYSPASRASKIHTVSPATDIFLEKPSERYVNGSVEDDSGWETVSHEDNYQGLSNSPEGSDPSVNGMFAESNGGSVSGTELNSEISEVYSATTKHSRKKGSSITKLWRSSCPDNGENFKKGSADTISNGRLSNGRVSNGRTSNAMLSPNQGLGEIGLSPTSLEQWSSPDSGNPHINRGMKGCIEWPRGIQKHSLKAKLLEARLESQKIQLRHVLKQKA